LSHRFFLFLVLLFPLVCPAQIDQNKLDSLKKSIDSSAAARKVWQDSFTNVQDSVYQDAIKKTVGAERGPKEQRQQNVERQRTMQGILIALLIVTAVLLILRRRKKKSA